MRIKILRTENATVRDAIDHLRDDGMMHMAEAVEQLLAKYEQTEIDNVKKGLSQSAR
mgnify:CR=1 FL=1